jgi:hypothetical protein
MRTIWDTTFIITLGIIVTLLSPILVPALFIWLWAHERDLPAELPVEETWV